MPASVLDAVCTVYRGPGKANKNLAEESSPACELGLGVMRELCHMRTPAGERRVSIINANL